MFEERRLILNKIYGFFVFPIISKLGYRITRNNTITSFEKALKRTSIKIPNISTVIDVGASDGRWSKNLLTFYPVSEYLLVEANNTHKAGLDEFIQKSENLSYKICAAGDIDGGSYFDASDPFGGLASKNSIDSATNQITVQMRKIDTLVEERQLEPPYLIKLDTHGFEVPILEGAKNTLKETDILIIETYNFNLTKDSLLFFEMCKYCESIGFRPIDIIDPLFRPKDESFWQIDIIFIKKDNPIFLDNKYA